MYSSVFRLSDIRYIYFYVYMYIYIPWIHTSFSMNSNEQICCRIDALAVCHHVTSWLPCFNVVSIAFYCVYPLDPNPLTPPQEIAQAALSTAVAENKLELEKQVVCKTGFGDGLKGHLKPRFTNQSKRSAPFCHLEPKWDPAHHLWLTTLQSSWKVQLWNFYMTYVYAIPLLGIQAIG